MIEFQCSIIQYNNHLKYLFDGCLSWKHPSGVRFILRTPKIYLSFCLICSSKIGPMSSCQTIYFWRKLKIYHVPPGAAHHRMYLGDFKTLIFTRCFLESLGMITYKVILVTCKYYLLLSIKKRGPGNVELVFHSPCGRRSYFVGRR